MKINDLKDLLHDKRVTEEINKHLWIESQKLGYSIGTERATEEWLKLYAIGWMRYNMPEEYEHFMRKHKTKAHKSNGGLKQKAGTNGRK